MLVTAISGNVWTVTRGYAGTSAAAHNPWVAVTILTSGCEAGAGGGLGTVMLFGGATGTSVDGSIPTSLVLDAGSFVTGLLPLSNITYGTSDQILVTNSGGTGLQWVTGTGDVVYTDAGVAQIANVTNYNSFTIAPTATVTTTNATPTTLYTEPAEALGTVYDWIMTVVGNDGFGNVYRADFPASTTSGPTPVPSPSSHRRRRTWSRAAPATRGQP